MSDSPLCSLIISQDVPPDEIASLESSLQLNGISVQKSTPRTGLEEIILIVGFASGVLTLADYTVKFSKALIKWIKHLKAQEIYIDATLEHPSLSPLDLEMATDEEIKEWLLSLLENDEL